MKYRKKPVVIEAMQVPPEWTGQGVPIELAALALWLRAGDGRWEYCQNGGIEIITLEGTMRANPGDWIIRGVKDELYPCKPDIFAATYEAVQYED
jgi:hypothetical protein